MEALESVVAGQGPFAGDPCGRLSLSRESAGRSRGILTSAGQQKVVEVVNAVGVASKSQIRILAALSEDRAAHILRLLFRLGFLDRLVTGRTPPLYVLGPESERLLGAPRKEWDVLEAFRLAASSQFYAQMSRVLRRIEYRPQPHLGITALLEMNGSRYGLLAPRLWPGESDWFTECSAGFAVPLRMIVVAATEDQAREISRLTTFEPARFTWDAALRDRVVLHGKGDRGLLEVAETFSAGGVDKPLPIG